jgi:putative transposase
LTVERPHRNQFKIQCEAKDETTDWLLWYDRDRLHSTLAYVSTMQFEQDWTANQPQQANSSTRPRDTDSRGKVILIG